MNRRYQKGDNKNRLKDQATACAATRPVRRKLDKAVYEDALRRERGRSSISHWNKHQRFTGTSEMESSGLWQVVHFLRQVEFAQDEVEDALTWLAEYGWRGVQEWPEIERRVREVLGS